MSNIHPTPTGSNAGYQQTLYTTLGSASSSHGKHRQTPYNYPFISPSANESFVRTHDHHSSNNAGYQHPLLSRGFLGSVVSTTSSQSQPVYRYRHPFNSYGFFMPPLYSPRGGNSGYNRAPYLPGGYTSFSNPLNQSGTSSPLIYPPANSPLLSDDHGMEEEEEEDDDDNDDNALFFHVGSKRPHEEIIRFPNTLNQSGTSSPLITPPANHPLLSDDHGVEEEDDDDDSLFSGNTNRRDNEVVDYVDLVSNSSANGEEDIEENEKENDHEVVMSNSSINEKEDIVTLEDLKTKAATSTLTENLKSLYLKKFNTDVTIKVQNKEFTAHKVILNARLEYFTSMFGHNFSENEAGIIEITDCDPESFDDFLLFLYTADLKIVSSQNVIGLYKTSEKYGCKELLEKCIRYMIRELSVDTFCDYFQIATLHNESDLLEAAINFFIKNAKQIFLTTKWLAHMEEHPSLCNELLIKYSNADNSCRK